MDREELNERARRLVFASPAISAAWSRGDFRSLFRGRGLDFDSLRDYGPGEDARLIDWNATARQGRPYVRAWRDDRSLTLFLLVDRSASMEEGSGEYSKLDMALLSAALLGRAASLRDMPVGGIQFDRDIIGSLAPRRGRSADLVFATMTAPPSDLARGEAVAEGRSPGPEVTGKEAAGKEATEPEGGPAGLAKAIESAARLLKRRSLVVILSDWRSPLWRDPLALLGGRHDVVAVRIRDRLEEELPSPGSFGAVDAEKGFRLFLSPGSAKQRKEWKAFWARDAERIRRSFAECRVAGLELDTRDDPALRFLDFFDSRRRKIG
ncbi:MAG TPA: DUF58 domain-containing protein [Rectinemataceae bacterium]|nr:DUF58 domain-containing protein [Rectinemataceae bacterium]